MKEHNYTIPLNEALESDVSCFLCSLEDMLSARALEYYMGAAVMEPNVRIETNAKGFCRLHGEKMLSMQKKLPLMLALETRLDTLLSELGKHKKPVRGREKTCAVCERIEGQMDKALENCAWLLKNEPAFLEKYLESDGVCLHHFYALCEKLGRRDGALYEKLHAHMVKKLENLRGDITGFTRGFDYQTAPKENMGHIPPRAVETLTEKKG
ncbi:MAG: hypothetical protein IJN74_06950 [Clostridia bacterium]|nr:hypothetical protein [Clostridia bacterium]